MQLFLLILKKLSLRKALNALSVYLHYLSSILFKTTKRGGCPISISVEPGTACNLRCKECPSGQHSFTRPTGNIDFDFYQKVIDEFSPCLINLILYFQGEPFLHKNFFDLVYYASVTKNIFTVTSTNGHYLTYSDSIKTIKSGLDKIIISFDGITQEVYEKYRVSGNLETVKNGIKNLISAKKELNSKTPFIELQFIVFKHNEHQISAVKQFAKQVGVNQLSFKSAQIYDFKNNTDLITSIPKYARYKKDKNGIYQIKSKLPNRCKRLWESAVVTWDGTVLPCCFDKDATFSFGNLQTQRFKELDKNKSAKAFKQRVLKSRKSISVCTNCSEGLRM